MPKRSDTSPFASAGTRCISAHLPEDMYWQLKELAAEKRKEMKDIISEAANALFRENKMPVIPMPTSEARGKKARTLHK